MNLLMLFLSLWLDLILSCWWQQHENNFLTPEDSKHVICADLLQRRNIFTSNANHIITLTCGGAFCGDGPVYFQLSSLLSIDGILKMLTPTRYQDLLG